MADTPDDLAGWRKALRQSLLERREALTPEALHDFRVTMDGHIERSFPGLAQGTLAFCWPYRGEYDARHVAALLRERGARTALPVVVKPRAPLIFREWHPGVELAHGALGIPYPAHSPEVEPDAALVPMVGFDRGGYRLGYGGGFFDRTLGAARESGRKLVAIGVAFELSQLETIHPQPYDIPMDYVVTERGVYRRDGERLEFLGAPSQGEQGRASPVCYADAAERPEFRSAPGKG